MTQTFVVEDLMLGVVSLESVIGEHIYELGLKWYGQGSWIL